jgi:hypothetical protein
MPDDSTRRTTRQLLTRLTPDTLLDAPISDRGSATCLLAGLWLWHDFLDESHTLSQSIDTPAGCWWHAIMHRREGDFSNAKYWYRRASAHARLDRVGEGFESLIDPVMPRWDPMAFVDLVESVQARSDHPTYLACVELQRLEWSVLFSDSIRMTVGDVRSS